ncbi:hypothetical protein AVEN_144699-1 [Araneus ventricosus]|uniref:Sodium/bile acid cotransporter 7 n=1 Tax=Araneus ventricosus TaxID=182803 RepID=A0A4Y2LP51_ARAVE|nr:hypothetical protein AVEN_144699-1 [Araneus ventricosus]
MAGNLSAFYNNTEATTLDAEIEAKNYSCYMKNDSKKFEYDILQTNQSVIPVFEILFLVLLIITASSIGTEITWTQVKNHIKNPTSVVIVMVIQFFIKPLIAYVLMRSNAVDKEHAVIILIISCCPSEVLSNAFTYFCDGDLSLSIILSATSSVLAIFMLPLNLWVYGHSFDTKSAISPYESLSLYPVYIISFLVLGMLLKWKFPSAAHLLSTAQRNTILLPWLYAFITTSSYAAFSVAYQIHKQYLQQRTKKENGFELTCASQTAI